MENYVQLVKERELMKIIGNEKLSVTESFDLFLTEFGRTVDRRLASFAGSVHKVDVDRLRKAVTSRTINFVKNAGVDLPVPHLYEPGLASMMAYSKGVTSGVFLISSLKTESVRLYDWLKQLIRLGRPETSFRWSISNFDTAVDRAEGFVKSLPEEGRAKSFPMGKVYLNFGEMQEIMTGYNAQANLLSARDVELTSRQMTDVYELGQLLVKKIKNNDIILDQNHIIEVESILNRFVDLVTLCGALMTLMNELCAVFKAQIDQVSKM